MEHRMKHTPHTMMTIMAGVSLSMAVLAGTGCGKSEPSQPATSPAATPTQSAQPAPPAAVPKAAKPRLLDLGAKKCIPCKMMAPILDDLKNNYAEHFETVFIDVWDNPAAGQQYGIRSIPTQIFFDAQGKELFRHEGFISKQDILKKWAEFGVHIGTSAQ